MFYISSIIKVYFPIFQYFVFILIEIFFQIFQHFAFILIEIFVFYRRNILVQRLVPRNIAVSVEILHVLVLILVKIEV